MLIPVTKLPSNFKPYKFKSFKIRAINLQDAVDLGANPKLSEIQDLIQKLVDGDINAKDATIILRYSAAIGAGRDVEITDFV